MPRLSIDLLRQNAASIFERMGTALSENNADEAAAAMQEWSDSVANTIEEEFNQYGNTADMAVLQSRGLRVLTSEENEWYQKFIDACKSNTRQAITNLDQAMPVTIIDRVIDDMAKTHPLLGAINILNAAGATKLVYNATQMSAKLGTWGVVGSAIATELAGQIRTIDLTTAKYTAYFLIPKDFVKFNFTFAPMWVDQYVRLVLTEAVANGLESAFVNGDGNGKPTGLAFDISTSSGGTYTEKTAIALTKWEDYPALIANNLLKDANNDFRNVTSVAMVVNPKDYVKIIRPVQNTITHAGVIDMISHYFPTAVIPSVFVTEGTAKVGLLENYFAAINGGESGIIEYSDDAQFLQDVRVYTTRVYAQGRPVDNTSFINVNISGLEAPALPVSVKGTVKTKAAE